MDPRRRTQIRRVLRPLLRAAQALLLRVRVEGLAHVPPRGPLLIVFNHLSNFDGPLVIANVPYEMEAVGPGDFKLPSWLGWGLRLYGMTLIRRGSPDRSSLKALLDHLKAGRILAMAPSGGMWETAITDVKPGAAYLSQAAGAPILPCAIGGAYLLEGRLSHGQRPRITIRFGEVMPPVPPSPDRSSREADLEAASQAIVRRIYALLPPEERARYDRWARETYDLRLAFAADDDGAPVPYDGPPLPPLAALAEFIAKPNLFRPLWQNAGLSIEPFRQARFFAPLEVQIAARQLRETLTAGDFANYLPYRLGNAKSAAVLSGLAALRGLCDWAMTHQVRIKIMPVCHDPGA
jgi:1-acyl-sn-glycerol-3-phosphate acyltransferase